MKKIFYIVLISLLSGMTGMAQQDSCKTTAGETYGQISEDLDNLLNNWYVKQSLMKNKGFASIENSEENIPIVADSVIEKRLASLASSIELPFNQEVRSFVDMYTIKKRKLVAVLAGLSAYYFPIFEKALDEFNLPHELKYLAIIESALNPKAVSRCKATGLWQFMYNTARLYHIEMNSFVDERRDPVKSSYLAARYLRDLYGIYHDWHLVLAAYNCGPGNVNKAIKRSGGKTSFWEIYSFLPKETRGYVPAYISAVYTLNFYGKHNINPQFIDMPIFTDTIMVYQNLHLQQVADVLSLPLDQLKELNPMYKNDVIPTSSTGYPLRLPSQYATAFIQYEDTILQYKKDAFFPKVKNFPVAALQKQSLEGAIKLSYRIKKGDNLQKISSRYNVSVAELKLWNKMKKNNVVPGKNLLIYLIPTDNTETTADNTSTEKVEASDKQVNTEETTNSIAEKFHVYTVVSGDSIFEIARKLGVSPEIIKESNKKKLAKGLFPGQVLKIPKS